MTLYRGYNENEGIEKDIKSLNMDVMYFTPYLNVAHHYGNTVATIEIDDAIAEKYMNQSIPEFWTDYKEVALPLELVPAEMKIRKYERNHSIASAVRVYEDFKAGLYTVEEFEAWLEE